MANKTAIEWTDATWNPVSGCTKVSPGCDHCYAETITNRFKRGPFETIRLHSNRLDQPTHWKKPRMIFTCSMGDLFHDAVDFWFIIRVFETMALTPQHTYQILTKRPGRMAYFAENIKEYSSHTWTDTWPSNVWAGTSVESSKYLPRLDVLARVPARVRFVSAEPLLGPLDLHPYLKSDAINWVIAGGESGLGARPMHPDWVREIKNQCLTAGVSFFFKQFGEWVPVGNKGYAPKGYSTDFHPPLTKWVEIGGKVEEYVTSSDGIFMRKVGKKAAGAMLDGREWREFPDA